jgi:hypothetical protein
VGLQAAQTWLELQRLAAHLLEAHLAVPTEPLAVLPAEDALQSPAPAWDVEGPVKLASSPRQELRARSAPEGLGRWAPQVWLQPA